MAGVSALETAVFASVLAIISPVVAPVASPTDPARHDRSCTRYRGGSHDRATDHTASTDSASTQHLRLLRL
jgi:hypothetical protein